MRKVTMTADELELGMMVHAPTWTTAPDRVGAIVDLDIGEKFTNITVDDAMKFVKHNDDYITVIYL